MQPINRRHNYAQTIDPTLAYRCYEQRRQFIEQDKLNKQEKTLLKKLQKTIGHSLFLPENN